MNCQFKLSIIALKAPKQSLTYILHHSNRIQICKKPYQFFELTEFVLIVRWLPNVNDSYFSAGLCLCRSNMSAINRWLWNFMNRIIDNRVFFSICIQWVVVDRKIVLFRTDHHSDQSSTLAWASARVIESSTTRLICGLGGKARTFLTAPTIK